MFRFVLSIGFIVIVGLSGCIALIEAPSMEDASVAAAVVDLATASEIEVFEQLAEGSRFYAYRLTIDDPALVTQLAEALLQPSELMPQSTCPSHYRLDFVLADGSVESLGYACRHASPAFLRSETFFGVDQQVIAPDAFNRLFEEALVGASLQARSELQ